MASRLSHEGNYRGWEDRDNRRTFYFLQGKKLFKDNKTMIKAAPRSDVCKSAGDSAFPVAPVAPDSWLGRDHARLVGSVEKKVCPPALPQPEPVGGKGKRRPSRERPVSVSGYRPRSTLGRPAGPQSSWPCSLARVWRRPRQIPGPGPRRMLQSSA